MKRSAALCGIILGAFLLGSTAQADTVARAMNFRSQPSATGTLIGSVPKGATVPVLSSQNGWDYISYNGANGWIHGGNVTSQPAAQTAAATATAAAGTAAASTAGVTGTTVKVLYGMNFRAAPGMDGLIVGGVPAGTQVQYLGSANGWDQIIFNGITGWIASGRITSLGVAQPASTGTAASAASTSGQSVKVLYGMNFRAKPGMDGRIMGGVPAGSVVQYLGSSNGWDKIIYNGVTGWIATGRTAPAGNTAQAGTAAQTGTAQTYTSGSAAGTTRTVTNGMNFRSSGSLSGSKIGLIPSGSKVIYVTSAGGWDQVIYNGQSGWIKGGKTR